MNDDSVTKRTLLSALRVFVAATVLIFAGLGVGAVVTAIGSGSPEPSEDGPARPASPFARTSLADQTRGTQAMSDISAARRTPTVVAAYRVLPSVVSLRTEQTVRTRNRMDQLFGRSGRSRTQAGLGSGFAIDDNGTILTNAHVVRGADRIRVVGADGQLFDAELVGADDLTDLAVVRIPANRVAAAPLGTSSDLFIGEPAVALGNPSGYALQNTEATVTSGVISGVGRDIQSQSGPEVLYADMIQTDASINPGNSGGPLANADGDVIGVNSSIFSRSGGSEGLGFAIPIDRALIVAAELLEFGRVRRPWVGLDVFTERSDPESVLGRPLVREVYDDTPASMAGLTPGDEILSLNGRTIEHDLDWQVALVDAGVGNLVELGYRRGDRELTTQLRLDEIPSATAERIEVLDGLRLVTVTSQIQQERSLAVEFGALIVSIDSEVAFDTQLREGDVIWGINGNEVRSAEEAGDLFGYYATETDGLVQVHIARGTDVGRLRPFRIG